ncbi:unnamed protein product, partial [Rotaria sp. Silwood1]
RHLPTTISVSISTTIIQINEPSANAAKFKYKLNHHKHSRPLTKTITKQITHQPIQ